MTRVSHIVRRAAIGTGIVCVGLIGFLSYSLSVSFDNWPWTRSQAFTSGSYLGFKIPSDKRYAFDRAIELQRGGGVRALELLDAKPTTYSEKYKGAPIRETDLPHVSGSDRWHLGLSECNCWLVLDFSDSQLTKVTRYEYHGPTE